MIDDKVLAVARHVGIETEYWDVRGHRHEASVEALRAILECMKVEVPSVDGESFDAALAELLDRRVDASPVVVWEGDRVEFETMAPASVTGEPRGTVVLEDGTVLDIGWPTVAQGASASRRWLVFEAMGGEAHGGLPVGYHQICVAWDGGGTTGDRIERPLWVAPRGVAGPTLLERLWGVFAPLYAIPDRGSQSSVFTLDRLGDWIGALGGRVIATLPLLAGFLGYRGEPYEPSPYAPVSRQHWNELYLDLRTLGIADRAPLRPGDRRFPYQEAARARRETIESALGGRLGELMATGSFSDYSRFRATVEQRGAPWTGWPEAARVGDLEAGRDFDPMGAAFHELCQQLLEEQFSMVGESFRRREQRLYLDLPLGAHPSGYETWRHPEVFAWGASIGAPPDDFFERGQNWGLPPVHPALASADGHSLFREVVAHHCRVAGVLRIDHVMGLHRLFWVPDGAEAHEGVYVRYPMNELLAVLSIESCRHDCYIVGEDLGTVPDEVREGMARHDLLGMYVVQFQTPASPGAALMPPWQRCVASVDTHDTPTFAGWIAARDVDHRLEVGRCTHEEAQAARSQRASQVANLRTFLIERGLLGSSGPVEDGRDDPTALHAALLRFLGDSDASVLLVALEDLWGETEPQNVPGTPVDRPNWVQMFPMDLDRLLTDSAIAAGFQALQEARLGSHFRARHQLEGAP